MTVPEDAAPMPAPSAYVTPCAPPRRSHPSHRARRWCLGAITALTATWFSTSSAADDAAEPGALDLRLSYNAPADCPSGSEFLVQLQQRLAAGGEGTVDARVAIERRSLGGDYELSLRLRVAGEPFESTVRNASCAALVELAVLDLGMARVAWIQKPNIGGEAPPSQAGASAASVPLGSLALPPPSLDARHPALSIPTSRQAHAATLVFMQAELRANRGMLPRMAWGEGVTLGAAHGPWSLRLGAVNWNNQYASVEVEGLPATLTGFTQQSLELTPCVTMALGYGWSVGGCAVLQGHHIESQRDSDRFSSSVGGVGHGELHLGRGWRMELQAGAQYVLNTSLFDEGESPVPVKRLQPVAALAIGWEFGISPVTPDIAHPNGLAQDRVPLGDQMP